MQNIECMLYMHYKCREYVVFKYTCLYLFDLLHVVKISHSPGFIANAMERQL